MAAVLEAGAATMMACSSSSSRPLQGGAMCSSSQVSTVLPLRLMSNGSTSSSRAALPTSRGLKLSLSGSAPSSSSSSSSRSPGVLRIECKESRIGKAPIDVPSGVTLTLEGQSLAVKGPLGELSRTYPMEVKLTRDDSGKILVTRAVDTRRSRQMHGLFRTLTDNMIVGVSKGFEKKLQLIGVGYRAAQDGKELSMNLGFSHQVRLPIPGGISVKVEENTRVTISGRDKCAVGDFAAAIRSWRPPEPYKGKGIKYQDEVIRRKEGKVGKKK